MKSTDIQAIMQSLQKLESLENEPKDPGHWKINCSLLVVEGYANDVAEMIPIWTSEG